MKLGTETGSLINHLQARATRGQPEPQVGMGATILLWTDRHAATITAVTPTPRGTVVTVQQDEARVVSGSAHDGSAVYRYLGDPNGSIRHFRDEDGQWREVEPGARFGTFKKTECGRAGLRIGQRNEYRDPSF